MNRTIFGLAFLNYNWNENEKDIVDSYIPLACKCLIAKEYQRVNRDDLKIDFNNEFGLDIPLGAIESILKRMVKNKLLNRENGAYNVITQNIYKPQSNTQERQIEIEYNDTISNIIKYAKNEFEIEFNKEEVEKGVLLFLKEFDLDLMLAGESVELKLSKINENKKLKYIISKFIINAQENNKKDFAKIVDIAKGHAIATLITFNEIKNFTGNLNDVEIYLDSPIVYNLLGINGESNLSLANELVLALKKMGYV